MIKTEFVAKTIFHHPSKEEVKETEPDIAKNSTNLEKVTKSSTNYNDASKLGSTVAKEKKQSTVNRNKTKVILLSMAR